jgi:SAM-dependent methyltransferase
MKESKLWYFLNQVYTRYFYYKIKKLPQAQWQQQRWNNYGEIYFDNRTDDKLPPKFEEFFKDAVDRFNISTVLDIGCGGGTIARILCDKYPEINLTGIDIADKSLEIYNKEIKPKYKNFAFIQGSIIDYLDILEKMQLFYTYNVFMHLNETEIGLFFQYIANLPHRIIGIFHEPYTEEVMTKPYPSGPKDYCHNFKSYILNHNFKLLNTEISDTFGIFYFTTK